jgi:signal transduction histidine kinase
MKSINLNLFKSREQLLTLANLLPYPFIIAQATAVDLKNIFFNTYATEEFGYVAKEIKTLDDWFEKAFPDEDYRKKMRKLWFVEEGNARTNGDHFIKIKAQITSKLNVIKWYEVKAFRVDDLYVLAYVDINNEVLLQEELKKINENNDRMLSVLGHDLRSPIANLTMISSMATNNEISNDEFISMVEMINKESHQVLGMLETTFNWAKLNFNTIELKKVAIDYELLIKNIVSTLQTVLNEKQIALMISVDDFNRSDADVEIMIVIIRNLLTNAIKFSHQSGEIRIAIIENELVITDFGVGMSTDKVETIINKTNFDSTRGTNNELGIGMGMQLVLNLIEKMGASLRIESEINVGSTMRILLT